LMMQNNQLVENLVVQPIKGRVRSNDTALKGIKKLKIIKILSRENWFGRPISTKELKCEVIDSADGNKYANKIIFILSDCVEKCKIFEDDYEIF